MPVISKDRFALPKVTDLSVGGEYFFVNEDPFDGNTTLKRTILTAATHFHGRLSRIQVLSGTADNHLGGENMVALYLTAREALDEYIAYARWWSDPMDPKRPGDKIALDSVSRNVNILLRSNWKHIEQEARLQLDALLHQYRYGPIPVQNYALGANVQTQDGREAVVGGAELQRKLDQNHQPQPPYIQYYNQAGFPITTEEALSL